MKIYRPRNYSSLIAIGLFLLVLATSVPAAENVNIHLKNGAFVSAGMLDRNDNRIVLDLGSQVLTIPSDQITSESAAQTAPALFEDEDTSISVPVVRTTGMRRPTGSIDQIIAQVEEAVVIVSNPKGLGAGFIVDPSGLVITNHHVVRGEKYQDVTLLIRKGNQREKKVLRRAEVRAYSQLLDCALVQIPADEIKGLALPVLSFADPETIRSSMRVYAVGNPGMGNKILDHSVSQGIVSSTSRNFNDVLYVQTTAAVNPGNSGGPLVNARGEVVGLVTSRAIFQEGIAFALPVWYLKYFVENAKAYAPGPDSKNTGYRYHDPSAESEVDY
jgi:serine protease Do